MSGSGKVIRLGRIFRVSTGKTLIAALDHGRRHGPIKGLEDFRKTVEELVGAGVDAVMATPAMIERVSDVVAGRTGVIARIDGTGAVRGPDETDDRLIASVERAIAVGADAVSLMVYVGCERTADNLEKLAVVAEEASRYGIPVLAEALPRPPYLKDRYSPDSVAYVSRVAAELGADMIKTLFTGSEESFAQVVSKVPVPVVVLGGPKIERTLDVLRMVYSAVRAGAAGAAIGRNIFQAEKPREVALALLDIIHGGAKPEEAAKAHGLA